MENVKDKAQELREIVRESSNGNRGVSIPVMIAIVFIVLKMVGVIEWSWIWVLSPIWLPLGIAFILLIIMFLLMWGFLSMKE